MILLALVFLVLALLGLRTGSEGTVNAATPQAVIEPLTIWFSTSSARKPARILSESTSLRTVGAGKAVPRNAPRPSLSAKPGERVSIRIVSGRGAGAMRSTLTLRRGGRVVRRSVLHGPSGSFAAPAAPGSYRATLGTTIRRPGSTTNAVAAIRLLVR